MKDWERWQDFQAGSAASQSGVKRSQRGTHDQARRLVIWAYVLGFWGLPGHDYEAAARALTAAGYTTKAQDFKNAKRRHKQPPPDHTIPADGPGVREFVHAVLTIWPEFNWQRLVNGAGADYLRKNVKTPQPGRLLTH